MIYALFGVLFVASCILAYFSSRTWNWLHVTATFFNCLFGMLALVMLGNYIDWQSKWRTAYQRNVEQLAQERAIGRALKYGDPLRDIQDEPTVTELSGKFNRLVYQRGRVWRWCTPVNAQNNQFQLRLLPENAPQDASHGVAQGIALHAFLEEIPVDRDGDGQEDLVDRNGDGQPESPVLRLPGAYLGEFVVTGTDAQTITLSPTGQLDSIQQGLVKRQATWVLYEVMPVDGHFLFASTESGDLVEYVEPNDEVQQEVFGHMDDASLRSIFEEAVRRNFPNMPPAQQTQYANLLLGDYLNDGKALTPETERQAPEEVVWYKVRFLKEHSIAVDATTPSISETRNFYDTQGLSLDPRLMRGDTVTFKKGQYGIFKKGSEETDIGGREIVDDDLDDWIEQGICEMITPIYVRPLNSYQDGFHLIAARAQRVEENIRQITINIAQWQESKKYCDTQIVYRRDEKAKLDGDGLPDGQLGELPGFQQDVAAADAVLTALMEQKTTLMEQLSRIYRANAALREQLAAVQRYLKAEIDEKSRAAVTLR